jgi:flavin reductase (DIM6/NTAB) family NADH-FMN oxidoreductase RutF/DNA-binding GntR family transcriptional regulator
MSTSSDRSDPIRPDEAVVEQQVFRDVIGRFASGVTVITTAVDGAGYGTTASAVSSLSMEPPMLLVCLNRSSETQAAVTKAGVFGVNILAEGQEELAYRFARKGADKFAGVTLENGRTGVPLISDALANLECQLSESVTGGTHTVFLARVAVAKGRDGAPLTYFRGRFGRLEDVREKTAYATMRDLVLTRKIPLDQPLELAALARRLDLEPAHVAFALMKLSSEHLVTRTADGQYVATPLTVELADELFDARCTIEIGVADAAVGQLSEADVATLSGYAEQLSRIVAREEPDIGEFLQASHGYHSYLVGLAGCARLTEMYERLGISALWRRAISDQPWWFKFDVQHHAQLTQACRDGDAVRAKQLIYEHADQVKALVRDVISDAGGKL